MQLTDTEETRFHELEEKGKRCSEQENIEFQELLDKWYDQKLTYDERTKKQTNG